MHKSGPSFEFIRTNVDINVHIRENRKLIIKDIKNILKEGELDETSVGFSDKSTGGRKAKLYNLDMILSVGYRVNSKNSGICGYAFTDKVGLR